MTTDERLVILERDLVRSRRLNRRFALGAGLALAALAFAAALAGDGTSARAQERKVRRVARAHEYILDDLDGKTRAKLFTMQNGTAGLAFFDEAGKPSLVASSGGGGPKVSLLDGNGKIRAELRVTKNLPTLVLCNDAGKVCADLSVVEAGPKLSLYDDEGGDRARIGMTGKGPALNLFDDKGKVRWKAP